MILKNYLFSQVSGIYQQYTTDYSETFLKQFCNNCLASDQIAIHRDGNLIYYAYAHKNSDSELYGICIVCGEICLNLQWLYEFLQKALEASAKKGVLFRYDAQGQIRKNVDKFSSEVAEVDNLFREIKEYTNIRQSYWEALPSKDFSVPLDSKISFAFKEDEKAKITDAIRHYHNVIVTMDYTSPSSFAKTVERLNSENSQLQAEKLKLENEIESLSKQKKQYKLVTFLSVAFIASLIGLYFLNDNLSGVISLQDNRIHSQDSTITAKDSLIKLLQNTLSTYKESLQNSELKLDSLKSLFPINITNIEIGNIYYDGSVETDYGSTIYSKNTMFLQPKITYTGINTGRSIDLKIKWYGYQPDRSLRLRTGDSSPYGYSLEQSIYVFGGSNNTSVLPGWGKETKGNWGKGDYRIEIWYAGVCLKAKNFTIY